jgi:hypothetical protein
MVLFFGGDIPEDIGYEIYKLGTLVQALIQSVLRLIWVDEQKSMNFTEASLKAYFISFNCFERFMDEGGPNIIIT